MARTFQPSVFSARANSVPTQAELQAWAETSWMTLNANDKLAAAKQQRSTYKKAYDACKGRVVSCIGKQAHECPDVGVYGRVYPDKDTENCEAEYKRWKKAKRTVKKVAEDLANSGTLANSISLAGKGLRPDVSAQLAASALQRFRAEGQATAQQEHAEAQDRARKRSRQRGKGRSAQEQASIEAQEMSAVAPLSEYGDSSEDEGPNWLLYGGIAAGVVVLGGFAYWFGRRRKAA